MAQFEYRAIAPGGEWFLFIGRDEALPPPEIQVIVNWSEKLKEGAGR